MALTTTRLTAWRMKKKSGYDYRPYSDLYLLSIFHPEFKAWYTGFINDFLAKHPGIDGIEAFEPQLDFNWNNAADYNPEANKKFYAKYPTGTLGSANWEAVQAAEVTSHLGNFFGLAKAKGKEAHVVQTWTAQSNGTLLSAATSFLSQMNTLAQPAIVHTELSEFSGGYGIVRPTSSQFL